MVISERLRAIREQKELSQGDIEEPNFIGGHDEVRAATIRNLVRAHIPLTLPVSR